MTKKTILCVLVLVITGMLCAPVAAEVQNTGDWSFYILDQILARTDVKINGHENRDAGEFQKIHVPASLDRVDVQFDVTWGPDTKLTITREYIEMLREKYPDRVPFLYAHGGCDTYDVNSGGISLIGFRENEQLYFIATIHEHLAKRGRIHRTPGEDFDASTYDRVYDRFVRG